jgi:hypothetical protein
MIKERASPEALKCYNVTLLEVMVFVVEGLLSSIHYHLNSQRL